MTPSRAYFGPNIFVSLFLDPALRGRGGGRPAAPPLSSFGINEDKNTPHSDNITMLTLTARGSILDVRI